MVADRQAGQVLGGADSLVEGAGAFGRFGGVLGDVAGDGLVGQLTGEGDRTGIDLGAPAQHPGQFPGQLGDGDRHRLGGALDSTGEHVAGGPGRRGSGGAGWSVEADDGVEMHNAAPLELADLGEGDDELLAQLRKSEPGECGQVAAEGVGEALPQHGRDRVEEHRAGVVIAAGAQRLPEHVVICTVADRAGDDPSVRARFPVAAGVAGQDAPIALAAGVDRAEGWGGERDEQARVRAHRFGDAFAAGQAGADEVIRVRPIGLRAGGAARGAAGLAWDAQHAVGFLVGAVAVQEPAGGAVVVLHGAAEVDRLPAAAGVADLGGPSGKAGVVQAGDRFADRVRVAVRGGQDGDLLSLACG